MSIQHFFKFHEHEPWLESAHITALTYAWTTPSSALRARQNPEFHSLRNRPQLLAIDRLHLDKTVVRHGF